MSIHKEIRDYYKNKQYMNNSYGVGWRDCKEEVLKILKKNIQPICDTQLQKDAELFINLEAIKEIEKL